MCKTLRRASNFPTEKKFSFWRVQPTNQKNQDLLFSNAKKLRSPPPPTLVWKSAVGLCLLQSETESPFKIFSPCPPPTYHNKNLGIQQIHARERALSRFAARFSRCNPERPTKTRYESEASGSKICRHVYDETSWKRELSLFSSVGLSVLVCLEEYDGVWEV